MLAHATNTLCVDDKDYEKALKTFKEYANQEVFKRRVVSGRKFNVLPQAKEMPNQINYTLLHKVSNVKFDYSRFPKRAERELFA